MQNQLDLQYQQLLRDILETGVPKEDRTGTGTISVFGRQIRHNMKEGFPLLTTKKMAWKAMVTELLWFLRGDTNIKYLLDHGCNIWTGDAYKKYQREIMLATDIDMLSQDEFVEQVKTNPRFSKLHGELGPVYGKQWRGWTGVDREAFFNSDNLDEANKDARHGLFYKESEVDQIEKLVNDLKTNPDSRRLMVNAWNVSELENMTLPPCHYGFQVYTRVMTLEERKQWLCARLERDLSYLDDFDHERLDAQRVPQRRISLMFNQRSVDTFLGLPFNIASYGLLLEILGMLVNMVPDQLIGNLGDVHLYNDHIEQANEQITRQPYNLPSLDISDEALWVLMSRESVDKKLKMLTNEMFGVKDYVCHPAIKAPLSN